MNTLDKTAKQYIINNINLEDYDIEPVDLPDKISQLKKVFYSEYSWRVDQVGEHEALKDWLQGLPTVISIVFYNYDILQLAKLWGSLSDNPTERQEDKILENYWHFMAAKIGQLFRTSEKTLNKNYE